MGANALLCKPMESFLPVVAAIVLDENSGKTAIFRPKNDKSADWALFYLLVLPPLFFSGIQILSWSYYTLIPSKTEKLRKELNRTTTINNNNNAKDINP